MRRYFAACLGLFIAVSILTGGDSRASAETVRVAMVVWRGETIAEKGFRDGLTKLGYTAEITVVDAQQDRTKLRAGLEEKILPRLDKFDYIYSFGTTATQMTKDLVRGKVPHLFNIINAPVEAGLVRSMEEPGGNISGASNAVPLATQIQTASRLFPIKKLGLLFNPREKNAMIQRDQLAAIARKEGFEVVDFRSPPALDMLQQNLQGLADGKHQVDAVYLPADSFLISQAKLIGAKLRDANVKSIGSVKTYVTAGGLMGMVPDYHELGVSVAKILDRNRKGEPLTRIPVQVTEEPTLVINEQTRAKLGVSIPETILSKAEVVK
jgi:ABC-type uncharacterized transport system substrate-binding protein